MRAIRLARGATAAAMPDKPVAEQRPVRSAAPASSIPARSFPAPVSFVSPRRRESRVTCVSTTTPALMPKALPKTTFAVLRPTPASACSSSIVRGTSPPNFSTSAAQQALMFFALLRKKPVDLMARSKFGGRRVGEICRRAVFFEQLRRDEVDAFVGALRGKNRGDEQLQRIGKIQFAVRVGISPPERGDDFHRAFRFGGGAFAWHGAKD